MRNLGNVVVLCAVSMLACSSSGSNDKDPAPSGQPPAPGDLDDAPVSIDAAPPVQADRCTSAADCVVGARGCCGPCQEYAPEAFTKAEQARQQKDCVGKPTSCKPCKTPGVDPNYLATCEAGACGLVDVRTSSMSECAADTDCHLVPPHCCGCQGEPVAVSTSGHSQHRELVCEATGNTNCAACQIPDYDGHRAVCAAGHCQVTAR
jgi:hypothetical protein